MRKYGRGATPTPRNLFRIKERPTAGGWRIYHPPGSTLFCTRTFETKKAAADYLVALGHFDRLQGSVRALYHNPEQRKPGDPDPKTKTFAEFSPQVPQVGDATRPGDP